MLACSPSVANVRADSAPMVGKQSGGAAAIQPLGCSEAV